MKLSDFDYKLPNKYLAQYPSDERDECKLMLLNTKEQKIEHLIFKDIIDFFDDLMLSNNRSVPIPSTSAVYSGTSKDTATCDCAAKL